MNRFKGLDLVDILPEELWMEVCNIVQEVVTKTIPKKDRSKKAKWLSGVGGRGRGGLKIAENRKEEKEEREIYTQLNAEFQRIARIDKKVFLSEQ